MTMHINLSPEMEDFIKRKVATGYYGNATEVVRDAVRRMQAEDLRLAAWQSAIKKGDEQLDRGKKVEYSPHTLNRITQEAIDDMHSERPINPDVLP